MGNKKNDFRIFGLLFVALVVSVVFGFTLGEANFSGEALGADFYIGGPVAAYLIQLVIYYKLKLFDQGLTSSFTENLTHPIESFTSIEQIEDLIVALQADGKRITNKISHLEKAKQKFNSEDPREAFKAMGFRPARRGG